MDDLTGASASPGAGAPDGAPAGPVGALGAPGAGVPHPAGPAGAPGPRRPPASGTPPTGLSLTGLRVTYPAPRPAPPVAAVDGVDLEVGVGEVVALLGASGSGKSSLLRAVAGLEPVSGGDVAWAGRSVVRTPVHRRGFGLMFQDGQLFPFRDVAGNVAYGLTGMTRPERDRRVAQVLDLVGLGGYGGRAVTTLSGGQAQRVALARALAPRPRLLLLDEPLSALDRALREQLSLDLRTILREQGMTALYVTHDQDEAMTVADRVGVMAAGRLARLDVPERLWGDPGSRQVAEFLGYSPVLGADDVACLGWEGALAAGGATDGGSPALALAPGALSVVGHGDPVGGAAVGGASSMGGVLVDGASSATGASAVSAGPGALVGGVPPMSSVLVGGIAAGGAPPVGGASSVDEALGARGGAFSAPGPERVRALTAAARVTGLRARRGERWAEVQLLGAGGPVGAAAALVPDGVVVGHGQEVRVRLDPSRTAGVRDGGR